MVTGDDHKLVTEHGPVKDGLRRLRRIVRGAEQEVTDPGMGRGSPLTLRTYLMPTRLSIQLESCCCKNYLLQVYLEITKDSMCSA